MYERDLSGFTEIERACIKRAEMFATDYIAPQAQDWEAAKELPRAFFIEAGRNGLLGLLARRDLGGEGIGTQALSAILEILSYADMAAAFALIVQNNHIRAIADAGTIDQIDRYLNPMISGEMIGAFLLTEARGGSDAAAISTTAVESNDGYLLNGEKAWITNSQQADILNVFAQSDPALGAAGIISLQVPADSPGVVRLPAYDMLGGHAIGAGGFQFNDVKVEKKQLLVPPGKGFKAAMAGIDIARAGVAAMCTGMMQAGLDIAMPRILNRHAFGGPLADQQGLQWQLADVATDLAALRLLARQAAEQIDQVGTAPEAAAHAKKFATRAAFTGLSACMQAMGADGLKRDYPLSRHLTMAKIAQYLDGTTEIQNLVISRALQKQYAG